MVDPSKAFLRRMALIVFAAGFQLDPSDANFDALVACVCRKQHSFTLSQDSLGALSGVHTGAITKAPASGSVQGQSFTLRSELPSPGGVLPFVFTGVLCSTAEGGEPLALEGTLQCPAQAATAPSGGAAETAGEAEWCLHATDTVDCDAFGKSSELSIDFAKIRSGHDVEHTAFSIISNRSAVRVGSGGVARL